MKLKLIKETENSLTTLYLGQNIEITFSYETLMRVNSIFNNEKYSTTTSRHLNQRFSKQYIENSKKMNEENLKNFLYEKIKEEVLNSISDEELFKIALDRRLNKAETDNQKIKI